MDQQIKPENKGKTSTGLPIGQSYTPPTAESSRPKTAMHPDQSAFAGIFPDKEPAVRPASATINKPLAQVYAILTNVTNFPLFFEKLEKVENVNGANSKWQFKGEKSYSVSMHFDPKSHENLVIYKSEDFAGFPFTLAIHLEKAQADRGTVARIMTSYDTAAGEMASFFEKMFGKDAVMTTKINLQRFKAFCETGHVPTTEGQPSGRDEDSKIISPTAQSTTLKH